MPRGVLLPVAPARCQTSATAGTPTCARQRLVARFDEWVIIRSASQRSGALAPSSPQGRGSLSWSGELA